LFAFSSIVSTGIISLFKTKEKLAKETMGLLKNCLGFSSVFNTVCPLVIMLTFSYTTEEWDTFLNKELSIEETKENKKASRSAWIQNKNFMIILFIMIQTNLIINQNLNLLASGLFLIFGFYFYWEKLQVAYRVF
jgi:hypothetical protein